MYVLVPEADNHVKDSGSHGHCKPEPVQSTSNNDVYSSSNHQHDGSRSEHAGAHDNRLVHHVQVGDVVVDHDRAVVVGHEVHHVGQGAGDPATSLVVELAERLRCVGGGVGGGAVLYLVSLLQQ